MKVTKIQQQVKRQDRYSIYVDEIYSFSLNDYQLVNSGLQIGKEYTKSQLDDLIQESQFGKAYERALNYVMIRPRSEKEINDYLRRSFLFPKPKIYNDKQGKTHIKKTEVNKEQVTAMIDRVIERLHEKGYINDEKFARAWVNSRQLTKKSSKRRMTQELLTKGVDSNTIATVLQNTEIDESQNLQQLIVKKRKLTKYQDDVKLTQYLLRQGYNYEDIKNELEATNKA